MRVQLPPCPYLPQPRSQMDCRVLSDHGDQRGAGFYLSALEYGHYLWQGGFAARAVLCLDRAMGAELAAEDATAKAWPIPYAAMTWFLTHTPADVFIGNPRVHFQHYADRLKAPRRDQRRWRAWACWALTRRLHPDLPNDPRHLVSEPSESEISIALSAHGHPNEATYWSEVLGTCRPVRQGA